MYLERPPDIAGARKGGLVQVLTRTTAAQLLPAFGGRPAEAECGSVKMIVYPSIPQPFAAPEPLLAFV